MEREGFAKDRMRIRRYASVRYLRQTQAVELELPETLDAAAVAELAPRFAERYQALYGVGAGDPNAKVEISALRVDAIGPVPKPALAAAKQNGAPAPKPKGTRTAQVDGKPAATPVFEWTSLQTGQQVAGPAIIESAFTTVVVPGGAKARVDAYGNVVIDVGAGAS